MAVTRSSLIETLKSRGVRGQLSKMRKHELQELVRKSAASDDRREPASISLEPDGQDGGHYYNKKGETRSRGAHDHKKNPWPVREEARPAPPKRKKKKKKKKDPLADPSTKMTAKLANDRLNDDRHPVTGVKFKPRPGLSITTQREGYRWAIRGKQYGPRAIAEADIDKHLEGIDEVFQQEYPETRTADAISEDNIVDGTRNRSEPQRLPQPAIGVRQDGEGMSYQDFMRDNLKRYGGDMRAAAQAYKGQKGGHFVRVDGTVSDKEMAKYSAHTHRPRENPAAGDTSSEEEDEPEPEPQPRVTRATSPRSRRRIARDDPQVLRRFLESLPRGERSRASTAVKGYVEGPAKLSVAEAIRRFTARRPRDAQAVGATDFDDSGDEDQALSGNQGGEGEQDGAGFFDWMDKHPFIQSVADDAVGALVVGGIGLATGGLGGVAAGVADAALDTDLLGEAGEAAAKVASKVGSKVAGIADEAAGAVESRVAGAAESRVASVAESQAVGADAPANAVLERGPPIELDEADRPRFRRQDKAPFPAAIATRPGLLISPAEDNTGGLPADTSILSDGAKAANEKAANALETTKKAVIDAGKKELGKAKTEASSAFKKRLRESAGALGLGVVGSRGEQLASTYEDEFEADDDNKPRQTTDSPGLRPAVARTR
jgi:hypothetical protein